MGNQNIPITDDSDSQMNNEETEGQGNTPNADSATHEGEHGASEALQEQIERLQQENAQLKEQRIRAIADLDNSRRRAQQDLLNTVRHANEELLRNLLPLIDDFERSIESGEQSNEFLGFFEGVKMVKGKLLKLLDQHDVKRIEAVGEPFDVELHEALMRQPSDQPEGTVVAELEPGYTYRDKVLRHTKVIVSSGE